MSKNRYGRIYHSNHHHINLRFESVDARREFAEKFEAYHSEHDHDGEAPRFEDITAQQAGSTNYESGKLHDAHSVTIDGYATYEIEEYHEDEKHTYHYRYKPPTCCVPPLISIERKLIDSSTLERHELSAIFGDMPDEDYQSLLASVENDGFIDNVVRLYEGQILDGYHRYRAAKELNLLRKLRFKQWHEDDHRDGDPKVFVYGRNLNRRHYSASQRAQVVLTFHERFGIGNIKAQQENSGVPNGTPKTRAELAKEAGVGVRTIARAVEVEKAGEAEAVIHGEKTAGEVLLAKDRETAKQAETEMWEAFKVIEAKVSRDAFKRGACRHHTHWGVEDIPAIEDMKSPKVWASRFDLLNGEIRAQATWIKALIGEDTEVPPTETELRVSGISVTEGYEDTQLSTDRFAATAKKRKKQVLKNMWDTRIQAARNYVGDSDTDLNQSLTQDDLEKGFVKNNETYAEAFVSGMQRIDAARGNLQDFVDRAFEVDESGLAKVDISELEEEYRAIMTYAGDIRQWEREDWSPDTNWILPLIAAKKKKAEASPETARESESRLESDRIKAQEANVAMWKAFEKSELSKYLDKEDLQEAASKHLQCPEVFPDPLNMKRPEIWICYFNAIQRTLEQESGWVKELIDEFSEDAAEAACDDDLKTLREQVKAQMSKYKQWYKDTGYQESDLVSRASFSQFIHVYRESRETPQEGAATVEELKDLLDTLKRKSYPFAHKLRQIVRPDQPVPAEADETDDRSLNDRMDRCRADLLEVWQQEDVSTWEGLEIGLYVEEYGLSADMIAVMQKEIAAAHPKPCEPEPETQDDADTSLAEIDNLPAVKYFLETLLKQVGGPVKHPIDRDNLSVAVFDLLCGEEFEGTTEQEHLSILIDVAHSLVAESEVYPHP